MIMTTCLILWIPGATPIDGTVELVVDGLVLDGPLDEHPIAATATTTATIPYRVRGSRIRSTLRAAPGAKDAAAGRSATVRGL
jgi:hypothetical protein